MSKIDDLLNRLGGQMTEDQRGKIANSLLIEFQQGEPLSRLRQLLRSDEDPIVKTGIWIAAELGSKAQPLLSDITGLLHHPNVHIRFFAIDAMVTCSSDHDGPYVANVIRMIGDQESAVRWKVLDFLVRANEERLSAALAHFQNVEPRSEHILPLQWLLGPRAKQPSEIAKTLDEGQWPIKLFAVVAAARTARANIEPLRKARAIEDEVVRRFVDLQIQEIEDRNPGDT